MTLILKMTSHKTASIMLQNFAFQQVLVFALTSSSCYEIIGSKVNYYHLKLPHPQKWKNHKV